MKKEFWNERYGQEDFAYGEQPNVFFKKQLDELKPGKILLPAEGEGRNAVYAASLGWKVTAFDISEAGKAKAALLAKRFNVEIKYEVQGFEEAEFPKNSFDCIALIYTHVPADKRRQWFRKLIPWLKPKGLIILEGYSKKQLGKSSGGPQIEELLFSIQELQEDFSELARLDIRYATISLDEGQFHNGEAAVVRLLAMK